MSDTSHTPAPWQISDTGDRIYVYVCDANGLALGQLHRRANADLIVAAPQLLAALKRSDHFHDCLKGNFESVCEHTQSLFDEVKAAIAAAGGAA